MFGIGNTIGAGIFALTGVAAQYAGPSLFVSFTIAGGVALLTAMMYAELSSRIPINGSAFSYTYVTFGELSAFLVGWNLNLRYAVSSAGLARGFSSYFNGLLEKIGFTLPPLMKGIDVFGMKECQIEAPILLCLLTLIYTLGMQESNLFNIILTTLKLATLLFIIVLAFSEFDRANFTPFYIEEYGFSGTILAASMVFYGYLGFDFITTVSDDARKPVTDIPKAVFNSTLLCLVLYLLTSTSLAGMAKLQDYNADTAMADSFYDKGYGWASIIIYLCALFGIVAACFTNLISQQKVLQA